jgi:hypothetical protein
VQKLLDGSAQAPSDVYAHFGAQSFESQLVLRIYGLVNGRSYTVGRTQAEVETGPALRAACQAHDRGASASTAIVEFDNAFKATIRGQAPTTTHASLTTRATEGCFSASTCSSNSSKSP